MNNVRKFRQDPSLWEKLVSVLAYILLGWIVATTPPGGMGGLLSIFMILGILLFVFIIRRRSLNYFLRFHITQSLMLNLSLAALIWLLVAFLRLLGTLPVFSILSGLMAQLLFSPISLYAGYSASLIQMVLFALALVLAVYTMLGRYTELPWVSDGVRSWI